jgi:Uma2 family endonuclease
MPGSDDMTPPPPPEGLGAPGVKLTYDDFLLFPDDGRRHELIDGEHYVTPSPNIRHQRISRRLLVLIDTWLKQHPVGEIFFAPLDVLFSNFDVVEPDLLYVSHERAAELLAGQHVTGAPDIVVEIASPGTRRRDETRRSSAGCTSGSA